MNYFLLVILFIMAIQDYLKGEISNLLFIPLLLFIKVKIIIFLLFIVLFILYPKIEKYIGGADIKLIFLFLLIYSFDKVLIWLTISFVIALVYLLIKRKRVIRMFPCFFISYCYSFLIWH